MVDAFLALNAGSSSVKFAVFETAVGRTGRLVLRGLLDDRAERPSLQVKDARGQLIQNRVYDAKISQHDRFAAMLEWIEDHLGSDSLVGIGHRVVHGGRDFVDPIRIDAHVLAALEALIPLAPLHQPRSLEPIHILMEIRPQVTQVACFDTAFHHALAPPVSRYALPRDLEARGIRKFGFHGLSYEYIAARLGEIDGHGHAKRTVVAHLGNGASLCAMRHGRSLDTTMGFSALDGLIMGTRCGSLDPGIILYLLKAEGMTADEIENLLYHRSGLLGVSGRSSDMRELAQSDDQHAREAVDLFCFRVAREAAALSTTMGGLEALVFTGGIGEHSATVREDVCRRLAWLGVDLDAGHAHVAPPAIISSSGSKVAVRVVPTDEESVIAGHVADVLGHGVGADR